MKYWNTSRLTKICDKVLQFQLAALELAQVINTDAPFLHALLDCGPRHSRPNTYNAYVDVAIEGRSQHV